MTTLLFHVPIASGGHFDCTKVSDKVYLLSFESPPDNRLSTAFNEAFLVSLDLIESRLPKGVVITTSKIEKFYSNGLVLQDIFDPSFRSTFFAKSLYPLWHRLLTFSMPTVALLNGHTFAGGLITAMHHDYRIQNPSKGFLCMNEVLFGAQMDPALLTLFRLKLPSPATFRSVILEGHRFGASQALAEGLVDALGGLPETLEFIKTRDLTSKGEKGVYGGLREEMYKEQVSLLKGGAGGTNEWAGAMAGRRVLEGQESKERLEAWKGRIVSKL